MTLTAVKAGAYLHHVAFESANPERLAAFYADAMDMDLVQVSAGEWRCEGPMRRFVAVQGQDKTLAYAGMACRDAEGLEALRLRATSEGIDLLPSPSPYFKEGAFALRDQDGHLICFGLAIPQSSTRKGIQGPTQHLTFASRDVQGFIDFYHGKLGFSLSDRVLHKDGTIATAFTTSNFEHHTIACFKQDRVGVDHHSYEAGEWDYIRDWCDHLAARDIQLMWGPGGMGRATTCLSSSRIPTTTGSRSRPSWR